MAIVNFKGGSGTAFLISAGIVFEIIAYSCSSPQTTELNADKRAPTLMKWVHIGQVQAAGFIAVAATIEQANREAILTGGILAMVISEILYVYAKQSGIVNGGPPTEEYM